MNYLLIAMGFVSVSGWVATALAVWRGRDTRVKLEVKVNALKSANDAITDQLSDAFIALNKANSELILERSLCNQLREENEAYEELMAENDPVDSFNRVFNSQEKGPVRN